MGVLGWGCTEQWEVTEQPQVSKGAIGTRGEGPCTVNDSNGAPTGLIIFEIYLKSCPRYLELLLIPHGRKLVRSFTNVWKAFIKFGPNLVKHFINVSLFS